jgi:hypothetical protein
VREEVTPGLSSPVMLINTISCFVISELGNIFMQMYYFNPKIIDMLRSLKFIVDILFSVLCFLNNSN